MLSCYHHYVLLQIIKTTSKMMQHFYIEVLFGHYKSIF